MSIVGSNIAQSVAGLTQAERTDAREKQRIEQGQNRGPRRLKDEYDNVVDEVEAAEAIRKLASNDQEEAHEDRREHPHYLPSGELSKDKPPQIDVQG